MTRPATIVSALALVGLLGAGAAMTIGAGQGTRAEHAVSLNGIDARDRTRISGFERWTRLRGKPIASQRGLGSAHPGTKRIYVNRSPAQLAPGGRERFPYPVGTRIVKTASGSSGVDLIAIMYKVARSGRTDGGWDYVEYTRGSPRDPFRKVAGGSEGVCTGCHAQASSVAKTDWVFSSLK